ncbi:tRNA lysidine(34) synthetase TilS [Brevibacillus migulae]|uniref:tRNA lysidine(34) synthetase TilS n=1 Tax=Brevibacillus migulae TaxID=1644114 RepID=UPI00106DFD29|nr:tRNA lysidine(34) synthetase TilS [Brevibacillus migulae]
MLARVQKQIEDERLLTAGESLVVGVSGGTDSMALLHILMSLNKQYQYGWKIHVVHVNHSFRGAESDADAEYVQTVCTEWSIPCHSFKRNVSLYMEESGLGSQEASREVRYQLYQQVAEEVGARKVVLAHHGDDQVETVLFRMLRGTGIHGLAGIPLRRWLVEGKIEVVRPLLGVFRHELEEYCREAGLSPREDSSNASRKYLRNRIRLDVLPLFEGINVRYREHILQLAKSAEIDEKYLHDASKKALQQVIVQQESNKISMAVQPFQSCDLALQRRMIPLILSYLSTRAEWSSQHVEAVLRVVTGDHPSAELHLPDGVFVQRVYERISFTRGLPDSKSFPYCYDLVVPGTTMVWESGTMFHANVLQSAPEFDKLPVNAAVFDLDQLTGKLMVRNRRAGDRLTLLGSAGSKKLKELMIDCKVPKVHRDRMPLLVAGEEIMWVPGVRRAAVAAVNQHTTRFLYVAAEYGEDWQEVKNE